MKANRGIFIDQMQRRVELTFPPRRIISLVPSQTELLHDLGLEEEVVGITKFCIHPEMWYREKKRVGGTKQLNLEAIRALRPDLIIGNKEENTLKDIEALAAEFPVWMSDVNGIEDAISMIQTVGAMCDREDQANLWAKSISESWKECRGIAKGKVAYFIWQDPFIAVGAPSYIDAVLNHLGFENVMKAFSGRYPEVTLEELKRIPIDYIFLSSEPFPFKEEHIRLFQESGLTSTIALVDGEMFSWYGSRMLRATAYFKQWVACGL